MLNNEVKKELSMIAAASAERIMNSLIDTHTTGTRLSPNKIFTEPNYVACYMVCETFNHIINQDHTASESSLKVLEHTLNEISPGFKIPNTQVAISALQSYESKTRIKKTGSRFPEAICANFFDRLHRAHGIDLEMLINSKLQKTVCEQPKLILEQINSLLTLDNEISIKPLTPEMATQIIVFRQYSEGELTAQEYLKSITLNKLGPTKDKLNRQATNLKTVAVTAAISFIIGLSLGPWTSKRLFGYSSEAECLLDARNKYQAFACSEIFSEKNKSIREL